MNTATRVLWVLWPAFLVAGVLEVVLFAVLDPQELVDSALAGASREAVYSIVFLLLWAGCSASGALTLLLSGPSRSGGPSRPRGPRKGPTQPWPPF